LKERYTKMNDQLPAEPTAVLTDWSDRSPSISKLASALCKAQAKIEAAKKDTSNPFFKSKYADLASVWDAIRKPLADNELSILQEPSTNGARVIVTTTLVHSSGEYVRSSLELPVTKQDPQGFGSAITYGRRYGLQSITGVAPEDDDGNAASGGHKSPSPSATARPAPKASAVIAADDLEPKQMYQYDLADHLNSLSDGELEKAFKLLKEERVIEKGDRFVCDHRVKRLDKYQINMNIDTDDLPDSFKGADTNV
jgi:hypothetical protein